MLPEQGTNKGDLSSSGFFSQENVPRGNSHLVVKTQLLAPRGQRATLLALSPRIAASPWGPSGLLC